MTRKQSDAIAQLGTSPTPTPPGCNRGSKVLESIALLTKFGWGYKGQQVTTKKAWTQGGQIKHTEALAPKFLAADALLIARPNSADKQELGPQELGTPGAIPATQNGRKKR